ncbi:hypothetical protein BC937DRAFT_91886 [Endogone sp. FLAS-F59071]|nr:hypothetical protein BC937DRAFT_91886 [Endogone sp. FLAS-F59071]|eukprot:RUS21679.1 hypothetical protein BC937DRAFT_91886 [Endogone sp. FLAS-F59071]
MPTLQTLPSPATYLKRYWKPFVLCIHPDFFTHKPSEKKVNAQSLQHLQKLVHPILNSGEDGSTPTQSLPLEVRFFPKTTAAPISVDRRPNLPELTPITHCFELTADAKPTPAHIIWSTTLSFLALCEKLGIDVQDADLKLVKENTANVLRLSPPQSQGMHRPPSASLTDVFAREFRRSATAATISHLKDADVDVNTFLESNYLLFFEPGLVKEQQQAAIGKLLLCKREAKLQQWWGKVPVVIVSRKVDESLTKKKGLLVIPWDATKYGMGQLANYNPNLNIIWRGCSTSLMLNIHLLFRFQNSSVTSMPTSRQYSKSII